MQKLLTMFCVLLALWSCGDEHEPQPQLQPEGPLQRTVLVYIAGENSLSGYIRDELLEMRRGTIGLGANALVVYVDDANASRKPYILRIKEGLSVDSVALDDDGLSSDPDVMLRVLQHTSTHFPASEYGLVLWGHASGWIFEREAAAGSRTARRGFGVDNGQNSPYSDQGEWMNMPTLAKVLDEWGHKLKFILADCCQFQCIESAYELRNAAEYIIGSPAEIPGVGAPYDTMTRHMFSTDSAFYNGIVDAYYAQKADGFDVLLSVIRTRSLEQLATATSQALSTFAPTAQDMPNLLREGLIYYKGRGVNNVMYDMNDYLLRYAPATAYEEWKEAFDSAVVRKTYAEEWMSNGQMDFSQFTMSEERYGGVSMFVPQQRPGSNYSKYNADIKRTAWYQDARLSELGW